MALHVRLARWAEHHPHRGNALLVGLLLAVSYLLLIGDAAIVGWETYVAMAVVSVPLFFRRKWPVRSALVYGVLTLLFLVIWNIATILVGLWAVPVAVYTAAVRGNRKGRLGVLALAVAGSLVLGLMNFRWFLPVVNFEFKWDQWAFLAGAFAVPAAAVSVIAFLAGDIARERVRRNERLAERASLLEIEREQEVRIAAQDERARIAREMHDVVAHSLSVVIAQADGARYAATHKPEVAVETLGTIAETARGSLTEMRRLLGVLRTDEDSAEKRPVPDLQGVSQLVEGARTSGLPVTFSCHGDAHVSSGAQLTLYRVVQEGLTNVLKHAWTASRVTVELTHDAAGSTVVVGNDGVRAQQDSRAPGAGQGLRGLQERVALYGGDFLAGPCPENPGTFQVRAFLPQETT